MRVLLIVACCLLGLAPCGACVGVWLAVGAGWGVCAGSVGYGLVGLWVLTADLLPDREVSR